MNTIGAFAHKIRALDAGEEVLADEALLALSKLRDRLVWRNQNTAAVDEVIERLEEFARAERFDA